MAPGQRDSLLNLLQQEPGQREPRALTQAYALPPKDYFSQVSNPGDQNSELLKRGQSSWPIQGDQNSELFKRGSVSGNKVRGLKKKISPEL